MVIRGWILSAWLTVMSGAALITGCGATDGGDEPTALYGAPDACSSDEQCVNAHGEGWYCATGGVCKQTAQGDADSELGTEDDATTVMYGPQIDGDTEAAVEDEGPAVLYGPVYTDDDTEAAYEDDGPVVMYGPNPADIDETASEDDGTAVMYGPVVVDGDAETAAEDEGPDVMYGPVPGR